MQQLSSVKYPIEYDNSGGLSLSKNSEVRKDNLRSLLETVLSERILYQGYGIPNLLFESMPNVALANELISQKISLFVPQITFEVSSSFEFSTLKIEINWKYENEIEVNTLNQQITFN